METLIVKAFWDEEASVWVATSESVPGLVAEAETWSELKSALTILIPEMLVENGVVKSGAESYPFRLVAEDDGLTERLAA